MGIYAIPLEKKYWTTWTQYFDEIISDEIIISEITPKSLYNQYWTPDKLHVITLDYMEESVARLLDEDCLFKMLLIITNHGVLILTGKISFIDNGNKLYFVSIYIKKIFHKSKLMELYKKVKRVLKKIGCNFEITWTASIWSRH